MRNSALVSADRTRWGLIRVIIAFILVSSFDYAAASVPEKASLRDNIIGSTFKTLARTFVATVDIEKIKKGNVEKIKKMDEAKFRRRYAEIYSIIENYPSLRVSIGLEKESTKQQIIDKIRQLNKKRVYEVLDSVPDTLIAAQFISYLKAKKEQIQRSNIANQIQQLWNRIVAKANPVK